MTLRLREIIITAALLCCVTGAGYGQASMSFDIEPIHGDRDSIVFKVVVENNGSGNFILTGIQFMLTYDTSELHIDPARTIMNHRFAGAGFLSESDASYSNINSADPDTLLYKEVSPNPAEGVTIPKNAPLTLCTLTFVDYVNKWDTPYNITLEGIGPAMRQTGFTTTQGVFFAFEPVFGAYVVGFEPQSEHPISSSLSPCYPNPVSNTASTQIEYSLASATQSRITVTNTLGQTVARLEDGDFQAGTHTTSWSPSGLPTGMYFIVMETIGTAPQRFVRAVAVR